MASKITSDEIGHSHDKAELAKDEGVYLAENGEQDC